MKVKITEQEIKTALGKVGIVATGCFPSVLKVEAEIDVSEVHCLSCTPCTEMKERVRCAKCTNPFQRHHWKISRGEEQYHGGCFEKRKEN